MSKVLLVNPPLTKDELFARGAIEVGSILPPLGLAYIAAVLEKEGHEAKIIDGIVEEVSIDDIVKKTEGFDIVGIRSVTAYAHRSNQIADSIKNFDKDLPIVMGGPHASALPEESLSKCDIVVIGEGEYTMLEIMKSLEKKLQLKNVDGIAFKENKRNIFTKPRSFIKNLDDLPFPAWHLLPVKKYRSSEARSPKSSSFMMITSRGCPFNCTFCNKNIFGRIFRSHSPERVVSEIEFLMEKYKMDAIDFWDDTFTVQKDRVMKICDLLIEKNLDIDWTCECRVDCVDKQLLEKMKKSGCWMVAYGVESGCERMLKSIRKNFTKERVREAFKMTKDAGIKTRAYFMLGLIDETLKEMIESIEFAKELNPDLATFTLFTPLPSTDDYERALKSGKFVADYWKSGVYTEFNFPDKPIFVPDGMKEDELMDIHKRAYKEFYFRSGYILNQIASIRSLNDVRRLLKGALAVSRA